MTGSGVRAETSRENPAYETLSSEGYRQSSGETLEHLQGIGEIGGLGIDEIVEYKTIDGATEDSRHRVTRVHVMDDETAEWYAKKYGEIPTNRMAVELAGFNSDDVVLDIGCGSGSAVL